MSEHSVVSTCFLIQSELGTGLQFLASTFSLASVELALLTMAISDRRLEKTIQRRGSNHQSGLQFVL